LKYIWHPTIDDIFAEKALKRGDNLSHLKNIMVDGTLNVHERFKSAADVRQVIMDENGPSLKDVLSLSLSELKTRNVNVTNIPHTAEERIGMQMSDAQSFLNDLNYNYLPSSSDDDEEEDEEEEDEEEEVFKKTLKAKIFSNPWSSPIKKADEPYSWYRTVWYRINMSYMVYKLTCNSRDKFFDYKMRNWYNAHVDAVSYLDSFEDPRDDLIDVKHLCSLYTGMGKSFYDDDKHLFQVTTERVQMRKTPLEIIRPAFPDLKWTVEELIDGHEGLEFTPTIESYWTPVPHATLETHSLYLACVYILNQCKQCMNVDDIPNEIEDALWAYYAGFTDLFMFSLKNGNDMTDLYLLTPMGTSVLRDHKKDITDKLSPWEMFGHNMDVRAFHAGDLPDLFHVLVSIPLWGEQVTPPYKVGKIYQKSLPFACQRRHLIRLIVTTIREDEAFWRIFSNLFWVMLASLYPSDLGPRQFVPSIRELIRSRELTSNKELLIEALISDQRGFGRAVPNPKSSGANGGPLVVFVVFRLHIIYMAERNPTYVKHAKRCIDWDYFKQNTIDMANLIRSNGIFAADPFAQARKKLSKTVKSPNSKVHRYRRKSEAITLMEKMNRTLEDHIFGDHYRSKQTLSALKRISIEPDEDIRLRRMQKVMGNVNMETMADVLQRELYINQKVVSFYDELLNLECKARILNMVLRVPPHQRLTVLAFSVLTLPQYGGISTKTVSYMVRLTNIYYDNPLPLKFTQCIDLMDVRDFVVCCYYFNMVATLSKISFVQLDADTVRRTDEAMLLRRHYILPGQHMPPEVFNVSVALCCEKICSLMGRGKYGAKEVSYDMERLTFICAHGKPLQQKVDGDDELSSSDEEEEEEDDDDNANVSRILEAQNDCVEDVSDILRGVIQVSWKKRNNDDMVADSTTRKGRGKRKSEEMSARKTIRNKRKHFHRIPCRQPVLNINLRGRALIWGGIQETQSRYMFCPECGSLHMYTILNFSGSKDGLYRCNECATKEIVHLKYRECAYCNKPSMNTTTEQYKLLLLNPPYTTEFAEETTIFDGNNQWYYFCHMHYNVAKRFNRRMTKVDLWNALKLADERRIKNELKKEGGRY